MGSYRHNFVQAVRNNRVCILKSISISMSVFQLLAGTRNQALNKIRGFYSLGKMKLNDRLLQFTLIA